MKKTALRFFFLLIITLLWAENGTSINTLLKSLQGQTADKQLELVTEGLKEYPGTLRLYILKAKLEMGNRDFAGAEKTLKNALEKGLTDTDLFNLLGVCLFHLDKKSEAETYFKKTLQEDLTNGFAKEYLSILNPVKTTIIPEESMVNVEKLLEEYRTKGLDSQALSVGDDYVFLLQKKELAIKNERLYDYTVHCVVKIETEEGIRRFRNFSQGFNNYEFYPEVLIARTHGTEGNYKDIDFDSVVIVDQKNSSSFYSNRKYVAFPFPNLQTGSLVEYKIRFSSTGNMLSHKIFDQFYFGSEITTMKKVYSVTYPRTVPLKISSGGGILKETAKSGSQTTLTFTLNNPPRYNLEGETISFYDLSPRVIISATPSWEGLNSWYSEIFYSEAGAGQYDGVLKELGLSKSDSKMDGIEKIYRYIQEHIRYAAIELGANALRPHPPQDTVKNKYGDCKDQVLLALTLLQEAGIDARPALVSTMDNGRITKEIPGIGYFNHVITYIPVQEGIKKAFFMDTTSSFTPFGNLPYQVQDRNAFIITKNDAPFFSRTPLIEGQVNRMEESYVIKVTPTGRAEVELKQAIKGSFSEFFRAQIGRTSSEEKRDYFYNIQKQTYPELEEENFIFNGADSTSGDIFITCKTGVQNATQVFYNGTQVLNLSLDNMESLFSYPKSTDYLYTKNFLYSYKKRLEYIFPEGYKITEQNLKNISRDNQYMQFTFTAEKISENQFVFEYEIAIRTRDVPPEDLEFVNRYLATVKALVNFKISLANEENFDYETFFELLAAEYPLKEVYRNYLERMIDEEKLEKAKEVCRRGEELFKDDIYFNLVLSVIHTEAEEWDKAENELHKALEKDKENFDIYRYLINLYRANKDNEKMEKTLLEAQKKFPEEPAVTEELISFYQRTGKLDRAISLQKGLIEKSPKVSKYHADLAYLYSLDQDFENSEKSFLKAIELDPKNAFALNNLAWLYCEFDTKLDKAIEYVLTACEIDPYNDNFWDTLAEAYFKAGFYDKAIEAIEKAISINPNYTYLKQQKKKIQEAKELKKEQENNGKQ